MAARNLRCPRCRTRMRFRRRAVPRRETFPAPQAERRRAHRVWKRCCGIISRTTGERIRANCSSPAPRKEGFAYSRNNVVRSGLKPILRKLGIPDENVGLHAFRHGLATELAESEPITVLQAQMRHSTVAAKFDGAHCKPFNWNKCSEWSKSQSLNVLK